MFMSNGVPTIWGLLFVGCLVVAVITKVVVTNKRREQSAGFHPEGGNGSSWGDSGHGGSCGGDSGGGSDGGSCGSSH